MPDPALVLDVGGTKILAALVAGPEVLAAARVPTDPAAGPDAWIEAGAKAAAPWAERYGRVAAAVTGLVQGGRWSALNPAILPVPDGFPLVDRLAERFGRPATAVNDAQAAAWGEHRFGAGQGADMAFVTLSTGVGGGIVIGGRLWRGRAGLAGHFGVAAPIPPAEVQHVEDVVAGRAIAAAARAGRPTDAPGVFAAARAGEPWAEAVLDAAAANAARLLANLQLALAPELIVVGGGVGLAPGHLDRIKAHLAPLPPVRRPRLLPAALGDRAGVVGAADLAQQEANVQQRSPACID